MATSAGIPREDILAPPMRRRRSFARQLRHYLATKPLGTIGLLIVVAVGLVALFAPLIAPFSFQEQNIDALKEGPSLSHFLGTDNFGRDMFSRVVFGARISLMVGLLAVIVGTGLGALIGLAAITYSVSRKDRVAERITRTPRGIMVAATAKITFNIVFPNTATMVRARIRSGKDIHMSTSRCTKASNLPTK